MRSYFNEIFVRRLQRCLAEQVRDKNTGPKFRRGIPHCQIELGPVCGGGLSE